MTGRVLQFPPRRASMYRPLVEFATPDDIYRKTPDQHPDLSYDVLANAGYVWTWRDDWDELTAEFRASPESHAFSFIMGGIAALVLVILPFAMGILS